MERQGEVTPGTDQKKKLVEESQWIVHGRETSLKIMGNILTL